jgi:hypothetical protein
VLRRLAASLPQPEDASGPAPPRPDGGARGACGSVQTLGVRNKPLRSCTRTAGCAVTPTASRIRCLRSGHLVRRVYAPDSAMDARLDTGGWLALTRQGLSPCKRRQACLDAITPGMSRALQRVGSMPLLGLHRHRSLFIASVYAVKQSRRLSLAECRSPGRLRLQQQS